MFNRKLASKLHNRALKVLPGGVNSPVMSFKNMGLSPVYFKTGKGSKLTSTTNKDYIDFICGWGPMILGHASPMLIKALNIQIRKGISYGVTTRTEIEFAELIVKMIPGIEKVRLYNSSTEANITAIRLARAYTGKNKVIKFEGCYHGNSESLLPFTHSNSGSQNSITVYGTPASQFEDILTARYNNLKSVTAFFEQYTDDIAAVIIEPVAGNMGCVLPGEGFLEGIRTLCNDHGALLILDEVTTGFRLSRGGAQQLLNIRGDIITLGKILGAGLPVGAVCAKSEIMNLLEPEGKILQAGILSGNPITIVTGYTLVKFLNDNNNIYRNLDEKTKQFIAAIKEILTKKNIPFCINQIGSMFTIFFTEKNVHSYSEAKSANNKTYISFYKHLLKNGILFPPSPLETCYLSLAHSERDLRKTLRIIKRWKAEV